MHKVFWPALLAVVVVAFAAMGQEPPAGGGAADPHISAVAKEWSGVALSQTHFQAELESFIRLYQAQKAALDQSEARLKWTLDNWVPKQPSVEAAPANQVK